MDGKFTLTLELGNEAMCNRYHIAKKLREVAKDITSPLRKLQYERSISDINGNRVGKWEIK